MRQAPLHGCRVIDLGIITAGAATSALLADLGADVIKVESPGYRDPFRAWKSPDGELHPKGLPPFFAFTNRGKRGVSLDLKHPDGHAAFLRLVAQSHVVVENFRRGVLERLGIGLAALRAANPDIILASISSQGDTGPDARYVSFGSTLEAIGGLACQTGYADGGPVVSGREVNYPDQVVAIFAAGMVVTAWRVCRAGGGGAHLDMSQRDLMSFLVGESLAAASAGHTIAPTGNSEPPYVIQDCFRGADGQWLALSVLPQDGAALDRIIGLPSADGTARADRLRLWIAARSVDTAVAELAAAGLTVAAVADSNTMQEHDGLWSFALQSDDHGTPMKGFPFQFLPTPLTIRRSAPEIGADTREVLAELGGYSHAEIDALVAAGAIEAASQGAPSQGD